MIESAKIESAKGHAALGLMRRDGDDFHLSLEGGHGERWGRASIEFVTVGGHGGGSSHFTRLALRHLFGLDRQPDPQLMETFSRLSNIPTTVRRYDDMARNSHVTSRASKAGFGLLVFTDRTASGLRCDRATGLFRHTPALGLLHAALHADNLRSPQANRGEAYRR